MLIDYELLEGLLAKTSLKYNDISYFYINLDSDIIWNRNDFLTLYNTSFSKNEHFVLYQYISNIIQNYNINPNSTPLVYEVKDALSISVSAKLSNDTELGYEKYYEDYELNEENTIYNLFSNEFMELYYDRDDFVNKVDSRTYKLVKNNPSYINRYVSDSFLVKNYTNYFKTLKNKYNVEYVDIHLSNKYLIKFNKFISFF